MTPTKEAVKPNTQCSGVQPWEKWFWSQHCFWSKSIYLEGVMHVPAEARHWDNKSTESKPEDKHGIVDMICLEGKSGFIKMQYFSFKLSTCLVMMLMVAESIGTARAQRTPVKSCSAGSLSIKWKPVLLAIKAVIGTWEGWIWWVNDNDISQILKTMHHFFCDRHLWGEESRRSSYDNDPCDA